MRSSFPMSRLALAAGLAVAVTAAVPLLRTVGHEAASAESFTVGHWVDTWVSMPQLTEPGNLPPPPFTGATSVLADTTLRQTIHTSVGGGHIRLRFSNAFGGTDLPVTAVTVALPTGGQAGVGAIRPGTLRPVTFDGRSGVDIPVGSQAVSDPLDFPVAPRSNLTVTLFLATGQASTSVTSHPGSRTTSYLLAGDHVGDQDLPGATTVGALVLPQRGRGVVDGAAPRPFWATR